MKGGKSVPEAFPTYRRQKYPTLSSRKAREGQDRSDSGERGYDSRWNRLSARFAKQNPFCRFCEQEGYDTELGQARDHIIPVQERPDLRLDWKNVQNLCNRHHNGEKRRLEAIARATGQFECLPVWCEDIALRKKILQGR
ncbi:MAG: HNH endonuclease [Roseibium sp.]|nr:HNH endonuclease [Roseibium sp.]